MNHLKHYTAIATELKQSKPEKFELLNEEINIIIHKLKFISIENRPMVEIVDLSQPNADPSLIEELTEIAGAQNNPLIKESENTDILIFINDSSSFFSSLPDLLNDRYKDYKAVRDNNVFITDTKVIIGLNSDYKLSLEKN